jgi:hypothetical protein
MKKMHVFLIAAVLSFVLPFSAHGQIKARITAAQSKLDSLCGTHNIKLAFTCQGQMWLIDFSAASPQIQVMAGAGSSYYPVISSDGRWVTYQTGIEAEGGPSSSTIVGKCWIRECSVTGTAVKVADTGYVPRFVQNTSADTPEVIYSTSLACPQKLCYNGGQTLKRKIINKVPQAPEVVFGQGSYYGGLSWDNRFLNTGWEGGPNGFILDLQDQSKLPHPAHTMRTLKIKKDSTSLDTFDMVPVGTCNISRPASRIFTNTMLYFDFGSAVIKAAGCYHPLLGSWKIHEKLFVSRYDGEDLQVYDTPIDRTVITVASAQGTGEAVGKSWDNPEWSNHPYFAAANLLIDRIFHPASGWQYTENHESVYLVDLKDSSYVKLLESTDTTLASTTSFLYPFAWVEIGAGFKEDSTWLAKTIWEKAGIDVIGKPTIGVKRNPVAPQNARCAKLVWSNVKASRIVVYSVLGQQIAVLTKTGDKEINPEKFLHRLGPGIFFIGIESQGQKRQIVRWVSTRLK